MHSAPLVEVFSSIQGEGAFVGEPQSFVRLAVCPLRCRYCDSESTWHETAEWTSHEPAGARRHRNPATVDDVEEALRLVEGSEPPRTVSLTGGEPLVHGAFLETLAPRLRARGRRVHLETAGVHVAALVPLLPHLDHVSADWKLTSTLETGAFQEAHGRFLSACVAAGVDTAVKCVVTPSVSDEEIDVAARLVASIDSDLLFLLQPVTPMRLEPVSVDAARLDALLLAVRRHLRRVRLVPQVHRLLGRP